jgi:phage repressor protein C with HTH and peptisase S24 domain
VTQDHRSGTPAPDAGNVTGHTRKAWGPIDPDQLSVEELARLEAESDPLIDLVGYVERHRADSPAFEDPRFVEWYCREQRLNHEERSDGVALEPDEVAALARRIRERVHADQLGVERVNMAPVQRQHEYPTTASQMVELLRGSSEAALADLSVAAGVGRALWDVECDTSVELPSHLAGGRYLALRVAGDSMTPLMHAGDVVLVKLGPEAQQDSVVVARLSDHSYVVKRVGRMTARGIELVSLNPAFPPVRVSRSANPVLGTVVLRWCSHSG